MQSRVTDIRTILTAIYFSKLYYGAEVWHIPGLTIQLHNNLKFASANALKQCIPNITRTEIHIYLWSLSNKGNGLDWNELLLLLNIGMNQIEY